MPRMLDTIAAALAKPRPVVPHPDPEDVCIYCEGRGFHRASPLPHNPSPVANPCVICDAVTTMGVYIIRGITPTWYYEFQYQTASFQGAARRAFRQAQKLTHSSLGFVAVHMLYSPLVDAPERAPTVVYSVPIPRPALVG